MPFPPIAVPYNAHHPYNASYPYILGNEYVPIKEETVQFLPEPSVEYGYRFRYEGYEWAKDQNGNDTLLQGMPDAMVGVYDLLKQPQFTKQKWAVHLYPPGGEYAQGPIRTVTIPVASWTATGNTALGASDTFNSRDNSAMLTFHYTALSGATVTAADFAFDVTGYRGLLLNKRILNVSLLYAGAVRDYAPEVTGLGTNIVRQIPVTYDPLYRQYAFEPLTMVGLVKPLAPIGTYFDLDYAYLADGAPRGWGAMPDLIFQSNDDTAIPPDELPVGALSLGNTIRETGSVNFPGFDDTGEYNYEVLETLHPSFPLPMRTVVRMYVQLPNTPAATVGQFPRVVFNYIGLKITYCDESRIGYGEVDLGQDDGPTGIGRAPRNIPFKNITIRTPRWVITGNTFFRTALLPIGSFPKGNYTMTIGPADIGEDAGLRQRFHSLPLYVTRQLYPTPMLDCVEIKVPYPVTSSANLGKTFELDEGTIMPKMSLLARSFDANPVHRYNSHVYSRQIQSPVYGDFLSSQRLLVTSPAVSAMTVQEFPNIRFFARHFPGTQIPLRVQMDMDPGVVFGRYLRFSENSPFIDDGGTVGFVKTSATAPTITGDIDIRADVTVFDWRAVQTELIVFATGENSVSTGVSTSGLSAYLVINSASGGATVPTLSLSWNDSGGTNKQALINIPPTFLADRGRFQIMAQLDVNNGAAGWTVYFYMMRAIDTRWSFIGSVTGAGVTNVRAAATDMRYAIGVNYDTHDPTMIVHTVQYRNGIDGTITANPDFQHLASGTTSFVDSTGKTWATGGITAGREPLVVDINTIPAAEITASEFDALTPLTTDGWAQVDLRLDPPMPSHSTVPYIRWSARGERAGSRWEVLGASSWEPTGFMAANFIAQYPVGTWQSGDRGTYTRGTDGLQWAPQLGPYVTGGVLDYRSDVSFLLAVDPPPVSGFGVSNAVQDLVGIATDCGLDPCCMPIAMNYLALSWDLPDQVPTGTLSGRFRDTFDRTESGGWGTPDYGPLYTTISSAGASMLSVADGYGYIQTSAAVSGYIGVLAESGCGPNFDLTFSVNQIQDLVRLEFPVYIRAYARYIDVNNYYWINIGFSPQVSGGIFSIDDAPDQGVNLYAGKRIAGTDTTIDDRQLFTIPYGLGADTGFHIRWMMDGILHKVKVWEQEQDEPLLWNMEFEDYSITDHYLGGGLAVVSPPVSGQEYAAWATVEPGSALDSLAGDFEIRARIEATDYTATSGLVIVKQGTVTGNSYLAYRLSATAPELWWYDGAVLHTIAATANLSSVATNGQPISVRAVLDVDNGAGSHRVFFYTSTDTDLDTATWTQLGSTVTTLGVTSVESGVASELRMGFGSPGSSARIVHYAQIRSGFGVTSSVIYSVTFDVWPANSLSFVDDYGWTWSINPDPSLAYLIGPTYGDGIGFAASSLEGRALLAFSDIMVTPPRYWFNCYEIQREDDDDPGNWQTIMKASNPAVTSFNDYEARPGIETRYRIRYVDKYEFAGQWSPEISGVIPAPGAQGGSCISVAGAHLLLFSSNEEQDGSLNLAYSSVWENGGVVEDFTFPDATVVQMQAMFDKNFYTAFRPMERAGEQFTRNMLVQAAAMSPQKVGNFTSLRDLSWDDINYVCVRDEAGNRWLASISVPSGTVKRRRTLYIAPVQVTEVTDTPTPVDPPWEP